MYHLYKKLVFISKLMKKTPHQYLLNLFYMYSVLEIDDFIYFKHFMNIKKQIVMIIIIH